MLISPSCGRIGRGFLCGFQGQWRTCWNRGRRLQGSVWVLPLGRWSGPQCHGQTQAQWWMSCFQVRWSLCRDSSASLKTKLQSITNLSNSEFDWMWLSLMAGFPPVYRKPGGMLCLSWPPAGSKHWKICFKCIFKSFFKLQLCCSGAAWLETYTVYI